MTGNGTHQSSVKLSEAYPLFDILGPDQTHIDFNNEIEENVIMNGFSYEYLYNGGGVCAGDFNNDGLPDLYFIANLKDNQLYLNQGDMQFQDVTLAAGVRGKYGFPVGVTTVDINADGKLDIYISKSGVFDNPDEKRNELYVNQGNNAAGVPVFTEMANQYGLDLPHYSTQAAFLDYDRDGDLDMFLLNHNVRAQEVQRNFESLRFEKNPMSSDRLFRNDGGKFIDISASAGMIDDAIGFGLGIAVGDVNNDGWPDLIVGHDYSAKDRLYINQQDGTFKELMNEATGHIPTYSMGNDLADFNNDGWLDFIAVDMVSEYNYDIKASMSGMNPEQFGFLVREGFHHQYMYNSLQLNNGNFPGQRFPVFSDVASMCGLSSTDWSWGPLFLDMDNDGDKDLFIPNGIKRDFRNVDFVKYKQKRLKEFEPLYLEAEPQQKRALLKAFTQEMLAKMPGRKKDNYFFENNGELSFAKRNKIWATEKLTATNGAAYADLDNDGDLDIVTNNMDESAFIYRNNSVELGRDNFLQVVLKGPEKNPYGIGSRVTIRTDAGDQVLEQYLSRGFQSAVEPRLHFGLGNAPKVKELVVTWTDGKQQVLRNIEGRQLLTLDYQEASASGPHASEQPDIFKDITAELGLAISHRENEFDDFRRESLLPRKMSEEGPALAVGDVNGDGFDDFYRGGSTGYPGQLFLQQNGGNFKETNQALWSKERQYEDVDAVFFDADNDDDLDLYIVSGGNEHPAGSDLQRDRLYVNDGRGRFSKVGQGLPAVLSISGSVVKPGDFDGDGDLDLFVGGKQVPGKYPFPASSCLLRNESEPGTLHFEEVTEEFAPMLLEIGMVSDATWADIDQDARPDLIIVGEWMPVTVLHNEGGFFTDWTVQAGVAENTGWWYSIEAADFDRDGDVDLVAGNLGLNSKYQASEESPFEIFAKDFDESGSIDIVLGYHQQGALYPLRGRECSSNQMPFIKKKFPSYHEFASADLESVYGEENLEAALHYSATNFATSYLENNGDGTFEIRSLPRAVQMTAIRNILPYDFSGDGHIDLIVTGNIYGFEVETPRQDAGYGLFLQGDGQGKFHPLAPYESGLYIKGEVAAAALLRLSGESKAILNIKNNDRAQVIAVEGTAAFSQLQ